MQSLTWFLFFVLIINHTTIARKNHPFRHYFNRNKRQQLRPASLGINLSTKTPPYIGEEGVEESGPWLEWSEPSECSRTCGGGVAYVTRQCKDGGRSGDSSACVGPDKKYVSCNIHDCPDGSLDFRSVQCSQFNKQPFDGRLYEWVPYTKVPNKCELNCKPQGERFYYRHGTKVIDGTRCEQEKLDVCIDGFCMAVGCDNFLGSDKQEDKCRVCDGDGSTCNTISGSFDMDDLQVGYNDILLVPEGATNIVISERVPTGNYLAIRDTNASYYLNGNWKIDFPGQIDIAGTLFHYIREPQFGLQAPESIRALGPTTKPIYIVLLYQEANKGIDYEYSMPKGISSAEKDNYVWVFGDWTTCTASCGGGLQTRKVTCTRNRPTTEGEVENVSEILCDPLLEPARNRSCNDNPCNADWYIGNWTECSSTLVEGIQYRTVHCQQVYQNQRPSVIDDETCIELIGPKPPVVIPCNKEAERGTWFTGPWSPCDHLCGPGERTREVRCYRGNTSAIEVLPDEICLEAKPNATETCMLRPCEGVAWIESEWSGCDSKCGLTHESRKVYCSTKDGKIQEDKYCDEHSKPNVTRECENVKPCEKSWLTTNWSECSSPCGEGVMTRYVFCAKTSETCFQILKDEECSVEMKPNASMPCKGEKDCVPEWYASPWSQCSKACSGGDQRRVVMCLQGNESLPFTKCSEDSKPFDTQTCNAQPCGKDEIIPVSPKDKIEEYSDECSEDYDDITEAEGSGYLGSGEESLDSETGSALGSGMGILTGDVFMGSGSGMSEIEEELIIVPKKKPKHSASKPKKPTKKKTVIKDVPILDEDETGSGESETVLGMEELGSGMGSGAGAESVVFAGGIGSGLDTLESIFAGSGSGDLGSGMDEETVMKKHKEKEESPAKKCKKTKKPACLKSEFGCCSDQKTPAKGLFEKGCPIFKTCNDTKYKCCQDGLTVAKGWNYKGCPESNCKETLFGCCKDEETPASGNDFEGCPIPCNDTEFGCCSDGKTTASGPELKGCPELLPACVNSTYGCCLDGESKAKGPDFKGCDLNINCTESFFGCCEDKVTPAKGPNKKGCLPLCMSSKHGCCHDNITASHGPNKEGCCLTSEFGCCPDNIIPAEGPNNEGCDCKFSLFGCCLDNQTAARGENYEGCGCQYTEHGCCPDKFTPALGQDFLGCACTTYQFGCCPDGTTVAKGPNMGGCGCKDQEFGCCPDNRTPAKGMNYEGCTCESSRFGCCVDGETSALGPHFEGCPIIPAPAKAKDVCGLPKDRGSCRNFTVRWFFDMEYGGCSRFWYGGCEGNGNNFATQEECRGFCVEPEGRDACFLPKVEGPCDAYFPSWYYDTKYQRCLQFIYGGCLGNNNRFETRDECENRCREPVYIEPCQQPLVEGPCHGEYGRWYYHSEESVCKNFSYGGCKGNENSFLTQLECQIRCEKRSHRENCNLPRTEGSCKEKIPMWYFDVNENRCMPFHYTGCDGNANKFETVDECERACPSIVSDFSNACSLPQDQGPCTNYEQRYFFDITSGRCASFVYGGCSGNRNNFRSIAECKSTCEDTFGTEITPSEEFQIEHCFLSPDAGPCNNGEEKWFYDRRDGGCKPFLYGGCQGNLNRFDSRQTCEYRCGEAQDICSLQKVVGPCSGTFRQWYYDHGTDDCYEFQYGGCQGNKNRFENYDSCLHRCKKNKQIHLPEGETPSNNEITHKHRQPEDYVICRFPKDEGSCNEKKENFFYDSERQECMPFTYGGCEGNVNRFESIETCERACGRYRGEDVCSADLDAGNCDEPSLKWYYDRYSQTCRTFTYNGCYGNGNRFTTRRECEAICLYHEPLIPSGNNTDYTTAVICTLEKNVGPCRESHNRWYFDKRSGTCKPFIYGGCSGNLNRFTTFEACTRFCSDVRISVLGEKGLNNLKVPESAACRRELENCRDIQCPYGIEKYVDNNNCEVCRCYDPCRDHYCPDGTQCSLDFHQDIFASEPKIVAVCRSIVKSGRCPGTSSGSCTQDCRSDADCSGTRKCCFNGCGYSCLDPIDDRQGVTTPTAPTSQVIGEEAYIEFVDESVKGDKGSLAVLRCIARGNPSPTITWYKNGEQVRGDRGRFKILVDGSLQIIGVLEEDAADYICRADNSVGRPAQAYIRFEVTEPTKPVEAKIVDGPPTITSRLGDRVYLECLVVGWPLPGVSWWRGGRAIKHSADGYRFYKSTLEIIALSLRDLGEYVCQAYNGEGRAASWTTIVKAIALITNPSPSDRRYLKYVITPQEDGKTTHSRLRPTPPPHIDYTTRVERVTAVSVPLVTTPAYYTGVTTTKPIQYTAPAPRINIVPVSARINSEKSQYAANSDILIPCDVQGYPTPVVTWYKDGNRIHSEEHVQILDNNTLAIVRANSSDSGTYKCEVANQYGSVSATVTITVEGMHIDPNCTDNMFFANCKLIVKAKYCNNRYYARFCCRSCTLSGQLSPTGPHIRDQKKV